MDIHDGGSFMKQLGGVDRGVGPIKYERILGSGGTTMPLGRSGAVTSIISLSLLAPFFGMCHI
jgi:hypothetical protein